MNPIIKNAGKDISHWFDKKTKNVIKINKKIKYSYICIYIFIIIIIKC